MSNEPPRIPALLTDDEKKALELLRSAGPDADVTIIRREGRIQNVKRETIHRREFGSAKLREGADR